MSDELEPQVDASVTETPSDAAAPIESTPDLSTSEGTVTSTPDVEWTGVRDYLKSAGIAADSFDDDEAAIKHVVDRARQYEQIAPQYQQVAQHWSAFQKWQAEQQQQQKAPPQPAPEQKKYWEPLPELDQAWLQMVARDPGTGQIVVKPEYRGAVAPDLPQKVQAYLQAKQDRESRLFNDPYAAIEPRLEERLSKFNEKLEALERQREQEQADQATQAYLQQNSQWLFQANEKGQPVVNLDGSPALTPVGTAFRHYLAEATQMQMPEKAGIRYAEMATRAWMAQNQPPAQPAQANEQHKQAFVAGGNRRIPNRGGTVNVSADSDSVPQNGSHDLRDMLQGAYRKAGLIEATAT
jgi:hypothetical protein